MNDKLLLCVCVSFFVTVGLFLNCSHCHWSTVLCHRSAVDRLVEDLIAESMAEGDFDNLPGKGKPLPYSHDNPYVDKMTHNINKILINNGYVPPWVTLEKEIRSVCVFLFAHLQ